MCFDQVLMRDLPQVEELLSEPQGSGQMPHIHLLSGESLHNGHAQVSHPAGANALPDRAL
jgi:hypothetical protein